VCCVGLVIAQGILGGLTVLFYLPPAISSAHAALAQTFFCVVVLIAVFTGRTWTEEIPQIESDERRPSLVTLTLLSILVLYVQLILGAMFRHHGLSLVATCGECGHRSHRAGLDFDPRVVAIFRRLTR